MSMYIRRTLFCWALKDHMVNQSAVCQSASTGGISKANIHTVAFESITNPFWILCHVATSSITLVKWDNASTRQSIDERRVDQSRSIDPHRAIHLVSFDAFLGSSHKIERRNAAPGYQVASFPVEICCRSLSRSDRVKTSSVKWRDRVNWAWQLLDLCDVTYNHMERFINAQ